MSPRRDAESGQYEERYQTADIVDLLRGTRLGTAEVAEELGCHRTTAHTRLHDLAEQGIVTFDQVGNTQVWSLAEAEQ